VVARKLIDPADLTDDERTAIAPLFPDWRAGVSYQVGDVLNYQGTLVRVVQAHTSQADWIPTELPALYSPYRAPGSVSAWVQPLGAQDAYQIGDRVTHRGSTWVSNAANNVWEPGVFGWTEE
jgi:hypothetical protein